MRTLRSDILVKLYKKTTSKAHVLMYFMLTFTPPPPHYILMVKGLLQLCKHGAFLDLLIHNFQNNVLVKTRYCVHGYVHLEFPVLATFIR